MSIEIPLIKPFLNDEMKKEVLDVLDSGYWTEGDVTRQFENSVKEYLGVKNVLAVCNCTVGLEMALRALNIGPGDEVIVPDYTYPATAAVVCILGATPVIVDIQKDSMLIDMKALENAISPKTKAVIPVSLFGNPLDYDRLSAIKQTYGIWIVEDAACSIGAEFDEVKIGNQADITVFSLHPRKFITTGEGGLVTTNDDDLAHWMNSYKHFGMALQKTQDHLSFERIGSNYKLSNIQAALGLVQMRHVEALLSKRRKFAFQYYEALKTVEGISIPQTVKKGKHSFQSCCIFIEERDNMIKSLAKEGIQTQIGTYSLHMQNAFRQQSNCIISSTMEKSIFAYNNCLTLPLFNEMTSSTQNYVIKKIIDIGSE